MFTTFKLSDCQLLPTRVDVWQFPLHTEFAGAASLLNQEEYARAKRYHFPRHQRRFTVARAMLRIILARYLHLFPSELNFTYHPQGKPQLPHASNIQFNLSHSKDLALVAIGQKFPLGIDIEYVSERPFEGIGQYLFSSHENKALRQAHPALKSLLFFHIWSQKEAFIKAGGLGLSYPTQQFDVPTSPPTHQIVYDALHKKNWHMLSFMPEVACHAALCCDPLINDIRYAKLDAPQMISLYSAPK